MRNYFLENITHLYELRYESNVSLNKLSSLVKRNRRVWDAIKDLVIVKNAIITTGATESLMTVVNYKNRLGSTIGMNIPKITEFNARDVGRECVEHINTMLDISEDRIVEFTEEYAKLVNDINLRLNDQIRYQIKLVNGLKLAVENCSNDVFYNKNIYGLSNENFNKKVDCLSNLVLNTSIANIENSLETLGYEVFDNQDSDNQTIEENSPEEKEVLIPDEVEGSKPSVEDDDSPKMDSLNNLNWNRTSFINSCSKLSDMLRRLNLNDIVNQSCSHCSDVAYYFSGIHKDSFESLTLDVSQKRNTLCLVSDILRIHTGLVTNLVDQLINISLIVVSNQ